MKIATFFLCVAGLSLVLIGCGPSEPEVDLDSLVPKVEKGKPSVARPEAMAGGGGPAQPTKGDSK